MSNLQSSLEAMKGSAQSLKEELGTDLLSQLSTEDQSEMDQLTDQIKTLTQQNKDSLKERIKVRIQFLRYNGMIEGQFSILFYRNICCDPLSPNFLYKSTLSGVLSIKDATSMLACGINNPYLSAHAQD